MSAKRAVAYQANFLVAEVAKKFVSHSVTVGEPRREGVAWAAKVSMPQLGFGPKDIWGADRAQAIGLAVAFAKALYTGKELTDPRGKRFKWPRTGSKWDEIKSDVLTRLRF